MTTNKTGGNSYIVDTNVAIAANNKSDYSASCALNCARKLQEITKKGSIESVVIDTGNLIFNEYKKHLSLKGQPGVGDMFIKWLFTNIGNADKCIRLKITPDGSSYGFKEFPRISELSNFDPSDAKFVALAKVCLSNPSILQATDTKWWGWNSALNACGVTVIFLCLEEIRQRWQKKFSS